IAAVLKAVSAVRGRGLDIGLVLVGSGNERPRLEAMAADSGIREAVYFLEPVPNLEMPLVYSAADVFVFAPLYEIFGMVVLEAMACGLPMVSTPIPAVTDILSANPRSGILTFPYSADGELAGRLLALAEDPASLADMGKANHRAAQGYSWQRIGRRFFEEYSNLL
ncbi:MAG: glycosyltransferase, partial [Deltaproteobacteria bacterium]|nr:glycosyltransferase [Deltaproteobacteria bacterium]